MVKFEHANILVAEDNSTNQIFISALLKAMGFSCKIAANGVEVIRELESSHYDLILMDCHMPELDGYDAAAKIRENERVTEASIQIPIIALTANVSEVSKQKCIDSGMNDFLPKPLQRESLVKALQPYFKVKSA